MRSRVGLWSAGGVGELVLDALRREVVEGGFVRVGEFL